MQMLAGQLKHLVKQTEMKWLLSFHSDKKQLLLMEEKGVRVCACMHLLYNQAEKRCSSGLRGGDWTFECWSGHTAHLLLNTDTCVHTHAVDGV